MIFKSSGILLYYTVFMFILIHQQEPSVFIVFFSLVVELVFLLLIYVILGFKTNTQTSITKANRVLIGSLLFVLIHYGVAVVLGSLFGEFDQLDRLELITPLTAFWKGISLMLLSLMVTSGIELYSFLNLPGAFRKIEGALIKQGFRVWLTGVAGFLLAVLLASKDKVWFLTSLVFLRFLVELYEISLQKGWFKQFLKNT